jgi:putative ABC transport system substrate-binding protein
MKRREFITLLGGLAAWPLAARAQQPQRMRRIAVLMSLAADDSEAQSRLTAFAQGLQELGWSEGRNVRTEYRWSGGDAERLRKYATELVALAPDLILATGSPSVMRLDLTRTLPIVFLQVADPVGAGMVESLGRPGGNATGFSVFEYAISAKWLELLKEIAPAVKRVAVLRDPNNPAGIGQFAAIQSVASSVGVQLTPVGVNDPGEIERGVTTPTRTLDGGLIVTQSGQAILHRKLIVALAARHRLPAVFSLRQDVVSGGRRMRRTTGKGGLAWQPSSRRSRNWAGPMAATCASKRAGAQAIPTAIGNTRGSWSRSRRMSSWP